MSAPAEGAAADFARRFEEFWAAPAPDRLDVLLAEQVRLVAPLTPTTHTLDEGRRAFEALFELIPDLRGEIHAWGETDAGLMTLPLVLTLIRRPSVWPSFVRSRARGR